MSHEQQQAIAEYPWWHAQPCSACRAPLGPSGCFIAPGTGFCRRCAPTALRIIADWQGRQG